MKNRFVQIKNPKTGRYIKIDRKLGIIVHEKQQKGVFKDIPVAVKKEDKWEIK